MKNLTVEGNVEGSKSVGGVIGYLNIGTVKKTAEIRQELKAEVWLAAL